MVLSGDGRHQRPGVETEGFLGKPYGAAELIDVVANAADGSSSN